MGTPMVIFPPEQLLPHLKVMIVMGKQADAVGREKQPMTTTTIVPAGRGGLVTEGILRGQHGPAIAPPTPMTGTEITIL